MSNVGLNRVKRWKRYWLQQEKLNGGCENMRSGEKVAKGLREEGVELQFRVFTAVMRPNAKGGCPSAPIAVAGR